MGPQNRSKATQRLLLEAKSAKLREEVLLAQEPLARCILWVAYSLDSSRVGRYSIPAAKIVSAKLFWAENPSCCFARFPSTIQTYRM